MSRLTRGAAIVALLLAVAACGDDTGEASLPTVGDDVGDPTATCLEGTEDCNDTLFPGDEPQDGLAPGDADPSDLVGGEELTVSDALEVPNGSAVLVRGFYVDSGDGPRLCEALAESFPPQCGGASVELTDIDQIDPDSIQSNQSTNWSDEPVVIVGQMVDGTLVPTPISA